MGVRLILTPLVGSSFSELSSALYSRNAVRLRELDLGVLDGLGNDLLSLAAYTQVATPM